jgi:hypothetical protein
MGFRPVAGGGAATENCSRRRKLAGRDEDQEHLKERESREGEGPEERENF